MEVIKNNELLAMNELMSNFTGPAGVGRIPSKIFPTMVILQLLSGRLSILCSTEISTSSSSLLSLVNFCSSLFFHRPKGVETK